MIALSPTPFTVDTETGYGRLGEVEATNPNRTRDVPMEMAAPALPRPNNFEAKSVPNRHKKKKKLRIGLSRLSEQKLKRKLRRIAPSEPWVEAQILGFLDHDAKGEEIVYRFFDVKAFPPPGMVECPLCGRTVPPVSMETPDPRVFVNQRRGDESHGARCMDCRPARVHQCHGGSPSAQAIREIQYRNLRLDEVKLESEDASDLKEEIRMFFGGEGPSRIHEDD